MIAQGAGRHATPALITTTVPYQAQALAAGNEYTIQGAPADARLMSFWAMLDAAVPFRIRAKGTGGQSRIIMVQAQANVPVQMDFGPYGLLPLEAGAYWYMANMSGATAANIVVATFVFSSADPSAWTGQVVPV